MNKAPDIKDLSTFFVVAVKYTIIKALLEFVPGRYHSKIVPMW